MIQCTCTVHVHVLVHVHVHVLVHVVVLVCDQLYLTSADYVNMERVEGLRLVF